MMLTPTRPVDPKLADALREAGDRVAAMTPVQRALMAARQAVSYVEGGLGVAMPDDHEAKITVRALALLDRVGDAAADALIKGEAAVTMWQPIETAPFRDTYAIVLWHGGHVSYEDLDHDSDAAWWRERGATHWALMPPPLAAGRLDKENDDA
jgi:hypothetical protein